MGLDPHLVLTSSIIDRGEGRAVVLLAARPDARRTDRYVLDATVVPEQPLGEGLRLVARWKDGHRAGRVSKAGRAQLRGIPASVLEAVQAGDQRALLLEIERADE